MNVEKDVVNIIGAGCYQLPKFTLKNHGLEQAEDGTLTIQFMEYFRNEDGSVEKVEDGVVIEGVLAVLIDRLATVSQRLPNKFSAVALTHLQEAMACLLYREHIRTREGKLNTMIP